MKTLRELEGGMIVVKITEISAGLTSVKLHKVDEFGLWVQSQKLTDDLLNSVQSPASRNTLVVFFPWSSIALVVGHEDGISLSRSAFGVDAL